MKQETTTNNVIVNINGNAGEYTGYSEVTKKHHVSLYNGENLTFDNIAEIFFPKMLEGIKATHEKQFSDFVAELNKQKTVSAIKDKWQYESLLTPATKHKEFTVDEIKAYLTGRKRKATDKSINKELQHLNTVAKADELLSMDISVEWKRSQMWGSNPRATARVQTANNYERYESGSISGCGYDKLSTAVAEVVNQSNSFLKAMYLLKEAHPTTTTVRNEEVFGYGSGYGIKPRLEGGVGVSCYPRIFETLGYNFRTVASGKTFDAYSITKVTA